MASQNDIHKAGVVASNDAVWESAQYSDMTVICGNEEFKLHRVIVCTRSKFFATACNGQYLEAQTGIIDLKEDDLPTVRRMLRYLYTLEYDDEKEAASIAPYLLTTSSSETAEFDGQLAESEAKLLARLLNNIAVYTVAEKYEIPELKVLAQEKVKALIWKHSLSPDFPIVINAIFHSTPSSDGGLREIAVEFCKHKELAIVKDERLCSMLRSHGDLGAAMVIGLLCDHAEYKRSSDDRKRSNQDRMAGLKRRLKDMECNAKDALTELDSTMISNNFHVQNARRSVVTLQANLTKAKEMATLH